MAKQKEKYAIALWGRDGKPASGLFGPASLEDCLEETPAKAELKEAKAKGLSIVIADFHNSVRYRWSRKKEKWVRPADADSASVPAEPRTESPNVVEYAQLEQELEIDRDALDEALIRQPQNLKTAIESYAMAVSERDAAKEGIKQAEALAYHELREHHAASGEKVTEKMLENATLRHPARVAAVRRYADANLWADKWEALREAFKQRGYVLDTLANLWAQGYFSRSSAQGPASRSVQENAYDYQRQRMAEKRRKAGKGR